MANRKIIKIDEKLCNGCGLCIPNCPEGAIRIIDGKARLISDLFCDGLGACLGHCPEGAITVEEREALPYNEKEVMKNIIKQGKNTIIEHLRHLDDHNEFEYLKDALEVLKEKNIKVDIDEITEKKHEVHHQGCPGSRVMELNKPINNENDLSGTRASELRQWPVQLHLVPPAAPFFQGRDVVLVADCVGYAVGDFHKDYMKDKAIAIACPKLDNGGELYIDKITAMIDQGNIKSLTVMMMEVPCCSGLLYMAKESIKKAKRKIEINSIVISINGGIIEKN
ncbi:MAG: 4Fe-4S binding protein [Spirochaetes bacterium]|nr:4Fe-4S binding protein [Spirochaetota bacterium]